MKPAMLQNFFRLFLGAVLVTAALPMHQTQAQSGSAGGSIGNDEKSLSGSREKPRAVDRPTGAPRQA